MAEERRATDVAIKVGVAGAIAVGAVVSGLLISRSGRKLVRELWQGRTRTRIEDRVLDKLWGDSVLGRREFDVQEVADGVIALVGTVRNRQEHARALALAESVKGVHEIEDHIEVVPPRRRDGRRSRG